MHLIAGNTGDGCSRISTNPRETKKAIIFKGRLHQAFVTHLTGSLMQIPCTLIIAQAFPAAQNLIQLRLCQALQVGKPFDKAFKGGQHGSYARLLQHHLGNPDMIGITAFSKRQIPAVLPVPGSKTRGRFLIQ